MTATKKDAWVMIRFQGELWEVAKHPTYGTVFRSVSDADWHSIRYFGRALNPDFVKAASDAVSDLRALRENEQ